MAVGLSRPERPGHHVTPVKTVSTLDAQANVLGGGCGAPDAAGSPAGYQLKFGKPAPADASKASLVVTVPDGAERAKAVKVNRTLRGFEGSTGVSYRVSANDQTLESSADPKTGALPIDPAGLERNPRPQL